MKLRPIILTACALLFAATPLLAQTAVNMPLNTGAATYTFNSGPNTAFFDFYDDGGPAGNYANSSDATTSIVTFVGPPGSTLQALFSAFGTEPGWDTLYVFDGASVAAPMIASANGAPISCTGSTAPGGWMGTGTPSNTATPGLVQSTGNSLTFQFCSDGSVPYPGWAARVTTSAVATDANLAMGLTASPDPVVAGASLTYVATLTNNGPDAAQDATITLNLPAGVNLVSATASGAGNCTLGAPVVCTWLGMTASGQALTATVVVDVPAGAVGPLVADASGSSATGDSNPNDNAASASVNVTVANTPSVPVPTLDARALALLVLGMLALGAFMAHRRS